MSIIDGLHRKSKNKKDFYITPDVFTLILCRKIMKDIEIKKGNSKISILDPCCGDGAITNVLKNYMYKVPFFEKYFDKITFFDKYYGKNKIDFLEYKENHDVIIMNPPYSKKNAFISHAIVLADNVYCLLPLQVENYISFTENFLDVKEYVGKIVCYPKVILSENKYIQGGITAYAWFHWNKNNKGKIKYQEYYDTRKIGL